MDSSLFRYSFYADNCEGSAVALYIHFCKCKNDEGDDGAANFND